MSDSISQIQFYLKATQGGYTDALLFAVSSPPVAVKDNTVEPLNEDFLRQLQHKANIALQNSLHVDMLMASLPATFETDDEFAVYLQQLERENEAARQELRAVRAEAGVCQEKVMGAIDSVAAEHFALQTKFAH